MDTTADIITSEGLAAARSSLVDFVSKVSGESVVRVEESFGDGFVRLRVGEAERRQAKHDIRCVEDIVIELLRNARDAQARTIFLATTKDGADRSLVMVDDGSGVPDAMRERIFDARVTSKLDTVHMDRWGVHGRGMALYSIKQNATGAKVVASAPHKGTSLRVDVDTAALGERKDQSTWPVVTKVSEADPQFKGPRNIIRTTCEFALEERADCEVYLGSPAEVVATMRARAKAAPDVSRLLFVEQMEALMVWERVAIAGDARELTEIAAGIGIDISERTAHRILAGQIKPLRPVCSRIMRHNGGHGAQEVDLLRDRRGLKISGDDVDEFSRILERDFEFIAQRYYLSLDAQPRVKVAKDKITVTFDLEKHD